MRAAMLRAGRRPGPTASQTQCLVLQACILYYKLVRRLLQVRTVTFSCDSSRKWPSLWLGVRIWKGGDRGLHCAEECSRLGGGPSQASPPSSQERPAEPARPLPHQQSGQCIHISTNMQNMNPALFCILILGFAYFLAYCCIYKQNNMHNMQNNMQENSADFS